MTNDSGTGEPNSDLVIDIAGSYAGVGFHPPYRLGVASEWNGKGAHAGKGNREKVGLTERYVMRDANKPNSVIVVFEAASLDHAKKFVSDPAFLARIKKASVSGMPDIKIGTTGSAGK